MSNQSQGQMAPCPSLPAPSWSAPAGLNQGRLTGMQGGTLNPHSHPISAYKSDKILTLNDLRYYVENFPINTEEDFKDLEGRILMTCNLLKQFKRINYASPYITRVLRKKKLKRILNAK